MTEHADTIRRKLFSGVPDEQQLVNVAALWDLLRERDALLAERQQAIDALREAQAEFSRIQGFLADVRQAMWKPAFEQNEEWAKSWHGKAQRLADDLAVTEEKVSATIEGREPDPLAGSLHDAR